MFESARLDRENVVQFDWLNEHLLLPAARRLFGK